MAKRTRYQNRTTAKPAAKRAARPESKAAPEAKVAPETARIAARPTALDAPVAAGDDMPARSSSGLTETELRRAAELEAEANAKEKAAIAESLRRRNRGQDREHHAADLSQPLRVRAAKEYAYVARDVRRITLTAGLMLAILAVLFVLINVMGIISI